MDNFINPRVQEEPPPAAAGEPVHGRDDLDLEDDAGYAPRQPHFGARPAAAGQVLPVDRDRVGHAARVPLDDGIGHAKIPIPPFYGSGSPEDFLEWEMCLEIGRAHV